MRNSPMIIAAVALFAVTLVADAEQPERPGGFDFFSLDTNDDSYVDQQEFSVFVDELREAMRARFGGGREGAADRMLQLYGTADADGDGLLNEAEFAALKEKLESRRNRMRDRRRDG